MSRDGSARPAPVDPGSAEGPPFESLRAAILASGPINSAAFAIGEAVARGEAKASSEALPEPVAELVEEIASASPRMQGISLGPADLAAEEPHVPATSLGSTLRACVN